MKKGKIDQFLTLRLTELCSAQLISPKRGWGESQQKIKANFFSKFNFLLNALGFRLENSFSAEL